MLIKKRRDKMEMIYAALLLHSLGKDVDEEHIKKIMEAAGAHAEHAQIKALVANLKKVNINEAIKGASFAQAAPSEKPKEEKAEAKKEEKTEEKAEEAAAGLSALFG